MNQPLRVKEVIPEECFCQVKIAPVCQLNCEPLI